MELRCTPPVAPIKAQRLLSFRKLFEVKMRGENDFRVKGENIGQPEVIFRKMIFSVTAKHEIGRAHV